MTWTDTEHIVSDPEVCGINHDPPSPALAAAHRRDPRHGGGGWGVGVGGVAVDGAGTVSDYSWFVAGYAVGIAVGVAWMCLCLWWRLR